MSMALFVASVIAIYALESPVPISLAFARLVMILSLYYMTGFIDVSTITFAYTSRVASREATQFALHI